MNIDDDVLFSYIGIADREKCSFKEFIKKISDYSYDIIKLDARFEIEKWLAELLERELFLSVTKKRHREHLLHACRLALLGERILKGKIIYDDGEEFRLLDLVRELFRKQKDTQKLLKLYEVDTMTNEELDEKILQIWHVAALFHDVGFIYEAFTEVWKNLDFLTNYPNFKEMYLDVEKALTNFKKGFSVSDVRRFHKNKFTREFDHSKIGACLISNLLHESNFICDVAAFITDNHSSNETLEFAENPLSFLLVLLDEMQEWNRPVLGRKIREQILLEYISKFSPFIEYPGVEPELKSISLSSDKDKDFEIKMENGNLNLDCTLDYGDNIQVLEKTNFSFPLMLYLKYKDLQRLRIGKEEKLEEALGEALGEVSDLPNNIDSNDKLNIKGIKKCDLSISLNFKSKGDLSNKWHRQCAILFFETLQNKNNVLSAWLDNLISYRTEDEIKFEVGNMSRVLSGDFKDIVAKSHETYLRDENISRETFDVKYEYEKIEEDTVKLLITTNTKLKNNGSEKIKQIFLFFDAINVKVKKVLENGRYDITEKVWKSPIPKKEHERCGYKERFVMSIPFGKPLFNIKDEYEVLRYEVETTIRKCDLESEEYYDGHYNIRRYNTERGEIEVYWNKEIFYEELKYCTSLFLENCTYEEMKTVKNKKLEDFPDLITDGRKLEDKLEEIEKELKKKDKNCKCKISHIYPDVNKKKGYCYFTKEYENLEPHYLAGFIWIPKG